MAAAAARKLGSAIRSGVIVAATAVPPPDRFLVVAGGHPLPTEASEEGAQRAIALAESIAADEALLVLLSGGASALMALPADGITLEDKRAATAQLLRAGADINALNTVRKHLSAIKGGWLAARAGGACRTSSSPTLSATIRRASLRDRRSAIRRPSRRRCRWCAATAGRERFRPRSSPGWMPARAAAFPKRRSPAIRG